MSFAHCYTKAVFFIFDVLYELKISLILTILSFICIANAFLLLFVFQLCFFLVQTCLSLIVKVTVGFLKHRKPGKEEHSAKEINVASRIPGDARFLCFIVFC